MKRAELQEELARIEARCLAVRARGSGQLGQQAPHAKENQAQDHTVQKLSYPTTIVSLIKTRTFRSLKMYVKSSDILKILCRTCQMNKTLL